MTERPIRLNASSRKRPSVDTHSKAPGSFAAPRSQGRNILLDGQRPQRFAPLQSLFHGLRLAVLEIVAWDESSGSSFATHFGFPPAIVLVSNHGQDISLRE